MIVKFEINSEKNLDVSINKASYTIDFKSDDKDLFKQINNEIIKNIQLIQEMHFHATPSAVPHYMVSQKIVDSYLIEINNIKKKLSLDEISLLNNKKINS